MTNTTKLSFIDSLSGERSSLAGSTDLDGLSLHDVEEEADLGEVVRRVRERSRGETLKSCPKRPL
jgi:hypothetical protein